MTSEPLAVVDAQVHLGGTKYRTLTAYLSDMHPHHVEAAVLVQHAGNTDNRYLQRCVESCPERFVAVGLAPDEQAVACIHRLAQTGAFTGMRVMADPALGRAHQRLVWQALSGHNLVATVRGSFDQMVHPDFVSIIRDFPEVNVVLEHMGGFHYSRDHHFDKLLALADCPHVAVMWSCFYRYSDQPYPHHDADRYLRATLHTFGAQRILFSGDWNRYEQGLSERPDDYRRAIDHVATQLDFLSDHQRRTILTDTARRLYRLPARPGDCAASPDAPSFVGPSITYTDLAANPPRKVPGHVD